MDAGRCVGCRRRSCGDGANRAREGRRKEGKESEEKSSINPGLLLQGWYVASEGPEDLSNTFRIRRAEISLKGEFASGRIGFGLMIDPARVLEFRDRTFGEATVKQPAGPVSMFQDFYVTYKTTYVEASLGQFKIPVSWEGYNSSSKLLFAERAPVSRAFGDKRDLGIRLAKKFERFGYMAGVYNGAALNNLDDDNAKDAALRLEAYPLDGFVLAGVVYSSFGQRRDENARFRREIDLRIERGPVLFQSEAIQGTDVKEGVATDSYGFYGAVALTLVDTVQPAVRVGYYDPNSARDLDPTLDRNIDEAWNLDLGVNYFLQKNEARLQLNFSRTQFQQKRALHEVILAAQVAF